MSWLILLTPTRAPTYEGASRPPRGVAPGDFVGGDAMRTVKRSWLVSLGAMVLGLGLLAVSADGAEEKADATLHLETKQVSVGIGWSWGSGTITYKGAKHRFKVDGLSVNAVGATATEATGYVYNLKKLEDFAGTYTSVQASGALGAGKGIVTMKNQNDVRVTLHSTSQGIAAQVGPEGVRFTLE